MTTGVTRHLDSQPMEPPPPEYVGRVVFVTIDEPHAGHDLKFKCRPTTRIQKVLRRFLAHWNFEPGAVEFWMEMEMDDVRVTLDDPRTVDALCEAIGGDEVRIEAVILA